MTRPAITRAARSRRLHLVHRGVYSPVPPDLLSHEGRLAAAILLGGDGSRLCAQTAAH